MTREQRVENIEWRAKARNDVCRGKGGTRRRRCGDMVDMHQRTGGVRRRKSADTATLQCSQQLRGSQYRDVLPRQARMRRWERAWRQAHAWCWKRTQCQECARRREDALSRGLLWS
jgi:hypothetical protein